MNDININNNDIIANHSVTKVHTFLFLVVSWLHACYKFLDAA